MSPLNEEEARAEGAAVLTLAQEQAARTLADSRVQAAFWKWVAGTLVLVVVSISTTYFAVARDYASRQDLIRLQEIVQKTSDNLNRLTGIVETHVSQGRQQDRQ